MRIRNLILVMATLIIANPIIGSNEALATPMLFVDDPRRPSDSHRLMATVGTVLRYELIATETLLSPRLTILDATTGTIRTFSMSFRTNVNGSLLKCDDAKTSDFWAAELDIASNGLCHKLPKQIVIGKTSLVVLYWLPVQRTMGSDAPINFYDRDVLDPAPASDAVWLANKHH